MASRVPAVEPRGPRRTQKDLRSIPSTQWGEMSGVVAHPSNPRAGEVETGESPGPAGQPAWLNKNGEYHVCGKPFPKRYGRMIEKDTPCQVSTPTHAHQHKLTNTQSHHLIVLAQEYHRFTAGLGVRHSAYL